MSGADRHVRTTLEELAFARRNVVALLVSDGVKDDESLVCHAIDALASINAAELDLEEAEDNATRAIAKAGGQ